MYAQNSSTPVNSYQDTALTVLNSWPVVADANGMMGQFWLADGSYRVRATTADASLTLFDMPSVQAIGPSSGAAPSGGVNPEAIFQTGDVMWLDVQGPRSGWVRDNGRSIGPAGSGASERANIDCHALFVFLWNNFSDSFCPVSGGRGANAEADWTNGFKTIATPDKRTFTITGLDDMGNSATGSIAPPILLGGYTTAGGKIGEATHVVTQGELPNITNLSGTVTIAAGQGLHKHRYDSASFPGTAAALAIFGSAAAGGSGGAAANNTNPNSTQTLDPFWGGVIGNTGLPQMTGSATVSLGGSGFGHNNMQRSVMGTFYRKL